MRKYLIGFIASLLLVTGIVAGTLFNSGSTEAVVQAQDDSNSDSVSVTVYNQGSALVQDRRTLTFDIGLNTVNFTDVASQIDATSVSFQSLTDPLGTTVLEQNYVYDLVNSEALLERYVDQVVSITTILDGQTFTGTLLSGRGGNIILQQDDGEVVVIASQNVRDIQFPALPDGLITRPTLRWLVNSQISGEQQIELTYLTGGMSWTADYNILLANGDESINLDGWVTLNNNSGRSFNDAQLKLVAGDVNRLPVPQAVGRAEFEVTEEAMFAADDGVAQREFFEYQLYEVNRSVTIGDNQTKQVEFVNGTGITADTFFVYDSSPQYFGYFVQDDYYGQTGITDVGNYLEFSTGQESGLGADLPAGRIRVYQEDVDGAALLIGENRIDHTPEGEDVRIYLGNAFDLVGERVQTDFNIVAGNVLTESYEIHLRNRKDDEAVEIRVPERLFRWSNWQILDASLPYEQLDAFTIEFRPTVQPGEEVVISYTVQYSWPR